MPASTMWRYSSREHVGHGEDELLLARVVLVDEPVGAGRSDHREKGVDDVGRRDGGAEVRDVALDGGRVVAERAGADPRVADLLLALATRRRGLAARAIDGGVVLAVEAGKRLAVTARRQVAGRSLADDRPELDPVNALVEVGDPVGLSHLAVVDHVEADLHLLADRLGGRVRDHPVAPLPRGLVGRRTRGHQLGERSRPDQTAGVCREDSVHVPSVVLVSLPLGRSASASPAAVSRDPSHRDGHRRPRRTRRDGSTIRPPRTAACVLSTQKARRVGDFRIDRPRGHAWRALRRRARP